MTDADSGPAVASAIEPAVRRHTIEWVVLGLCALLALVLGTIGFTGRGAPVGDGLYRSLQLFVLEAGPLRSPLPWTLEIARWLAPLATIYAAVRAALVLFHDQAQRVWMRFLLHDHVVVAGLGAKGYALAVELHRSGHRVVAIERDERTPAVAASRRRDVPVVIGDANDRALLARVRLDRASHFVVVTGDDRRNIQIAFAARRPHDATPLNVLVHLDDIGLWRLLQAEAVARRASLRLRLDFFNLRDAAARAMLEAHPPFGEAAPGAQHAPHVLVVASEGTGENVVLRAAGLWQTARGAGDALLITLAGRDAASTVTRLQAREPALERICAVEAFGVEPGTTAVAIGPDGTLPGGGRPVTAVYVCLDSEAEGIAVALALHGRAALSEVPIVAAVADDRSGIALAIQDDDLEHVDAFGMVSHTLTAKLLETGTSEVLARAKHEHYVECELERGTVREGNRSMVPWKYLDDTLKESNRRFADSIGLKLESAGCAIVPAPLADPAAPGFAFSGSEVEELARHEHDRWCHDLTTDGWRFGSAKDPIAKRHPKLLAWEELTEDDRDKDREPIRALPRMLAQAGFLIERGARPTLAAELQRHAAAGEEPAARPVR